MLIKAIAFLIAVAALNIWAIRYTAKMTPEEKEDCEEDMRIW